jgi:hypothetical protein
MLKMMNPAHADELMAMSQKDVDKGWKFLEGRAAALEPCATSNCCGSSNKKGAKKK